MSDKEKHNCINACGIVILAVGVGFHLYTGNVLWWFGAMTAIYPLAFIQAMVNGASFRWWVVAAQTFVVSVGFALSVYLEHLGYYFFSLFLFLVFVPFAPADELGRMPSAAGPDDAELERSG